MTKKDKKIKILIVDDHTLVREGLTLFLSRYPEFFICGEAGTGAEAVELVLKRNPDVVLLDLYLPDVHGGKIIKELLHEKPELKVLILTGYFSQESILDAIEAGASGFLYKDILDSELSSAIHQILDGEIYLAHKAMSAMIKSKLNESSFKDPLTCREIEVLNCVAAGLTNAQIAMQLSISSSTVDFHVGNILAKMKVSNRTEAVVKALTENII